MVLEQDFANTIQELVKHEFATIQIGESAIQIHVLESTKKLSLATTVYRGENYIPQSVRQATLHQSPFARKIHTSLKLNETNFEIQLRYIGDLGTLSKKEFRLLLEDFAEIADEWRTYLDDHDQKDRIHVRKPK